MAKEDEEDASILGQIQSSARSEGFQPGTPEYESRLDQMKVIKCREMRGHPVCTDCEVFDFCELIKRVLRANHGYKE